MQRWRASLSGGALSMSDGWHAGRLLIALLIGFALGSCGSAKADAKYRAYYQHLYAQPAPTSPASGVTVSAGMAHK